MEVFMVTGITHITLFVRDQEEALSFYQKLGFRVHTDAQFGPMRWLTICLPGQPGLEIALMQAETADEQALVGKQSATKPLISIASSDCHGDYEQLQRTGVVFVEKPTQHPWGIGAVLQDFYGNLIYMCQTTQS